jgi:cellulose synthase/poly-beta-1,6-N-acetylglucosamine synthase-like glycosyltransferase
MRGRNDLYGGPNYIIRTQFCLNKHLSNFLQCDLTPNDVEIVFVDWGSIDPIVPLLIKETTGFIRYIIVPGEITKNFDPPETGFDFVQSINVGICRSNGKFIMHIDPDVFMDISSFKKLWNYLDNPDAANYQHYFTRHVIPLSENFLNSPPISQSIVPSISGPNEFNGGSTAVLCSKEAWEKVGGYDEKFKYWGAQDVDLFARLHKANYSGSNLFSSHDITLVHIEHQRILCQKTNNPEYDHRHVLHGINPNGSNWGLKNLKFQEIIV